MNIHQKLTALTVAGLLIGSAAMAQVSVSTTFNYESKYVFRGFLLAEDSFMGSVDLGYEGFYAGVWTAQPIDDISVANEVDLYAGYAIEGDQGTIDFGVTNYRYPDAGGDTVEAFVGGALNTVLGPALYIYYDFDLEALTLEGSVGHSFDLGDGASFDVGSALGYIDADGSPSVWYYSVTADISYAFSDNASAAIGVRYSGLEIDGPGDDDNFWFGASFTAGF